MPVSRSFLRSPRLFICGLAVLGGSLAWHPGLAAPGAAQQSADGSRPSQPQRIEQQSQRARDRALALQTEADDLAARERSLMAELRRLERDRRTKAAELSAINGDLEDTTGQLDETAARMADLEREAEAQRPLVAARMVALYKMGAPRYARLLLGAGNLQAMGRASRLIGALARRDREQFEGHRQTLDDLQASRASLEAHQTEAEALQISARTARRSVDRAIAAQTALLEDIAAQRDLTATLMAELDAARQRLDAALATAAASPLPTLPVRPFRGQLAPPVPGDVTLAFGAAATTESGISAPSDGIELAVTPGEAVRAIHEGTVTFVGSVEERGTLVRVDHGHQAVSLYGHLASLTVREGDRIDPGTELGAAGQSPSGAPSVYFELRIDGQPVDPVEWLSP